MNVARFRIEIRVTLAGGQEWERPPGGTFRFIALLDVWQTGVLYIHGSSLVVI